MFCGFVALTKIVEADLTPDAAGFVNWAPIKFALAAILLACIFDLFDGRVRAHGGHESPFGREFDSLADLISFGAAPACSRAPAWCSARCCRTEYTELGWFIASIYLNLRRFRLARFNCLSAMKLPAPARIFSASDFPPRRPPSRSADAGHHQH